MITVTEITTFAKNNWTISKNHQRELSIWTRGFSRPVCITVEAVHNTVDNTNNSFSTANFQSLYDLSDLCLPIIYIGKWDQE